jgi:hypothetical protein
VLNVKAANLCQGLQARRDCSRLILAGKVCVESAFTNMIYRERQGMVASQRRQSAGRIDE